MPRERSRNSRRKPTLSWRRQMLFESLETRRVLATITWDGGGNTLNWSDASKWSGNLLPGANDDVVIPDLGTIGVADQTISLSSGSHSVRSITTSERVHITGGTLTVGAYATNLATLAGSCRIQVGGGTLALAGTNSDDNKAR